jgi:hypothetical protein
MRFGKSLKKIFIIFISLQISLFASFKGIVIDKNTTEPLSGVLVSDSKHSVTTNIDGYFNIKSDEDTYFVKAYGYRPYNFKTNIKSSLIELEPITVKALYLSFWGASNSSQTHKKILKIIQETELNAIVMDVKNEHGYTSFLTSFKQANSYGAHEKRTNRNIYKFIKTMKENNIYTIARIVTFKDDIQATKNPDYAIKNLDGTIWRNHDGMAWVNPYDKRSHDYAISIAEEAAKIGFDEINFDYIRFPAKKDLLFTQEHTEKSRVHAIETFLDSAKDRLRKYGVFISVDTYGNICWSKDDNNIGQTVKSFAKHVDYLAPMLYPSGFSSGSFYFKYPAKHPYVVIYRSIENIKDRIDTKRVRPWLQHFKDYKYKRLNYKKHEVTQQIKAAQDVNAGGWMLWSPTSTYYQHYFSK